MKLKDLIQNFIGYLETKAELAKLEVEEKFVMLFAFTGFMLTLFVVGFLLLIFLSLGASILINELLGSRYWGYLILAFVYTIIFLILLFVKFDNPIINYFRRKLRG